MLHDKRLLFVGGFLIGFGSVVRLLAIIENKDFDTKIKKPVELCTTGIYSVCRHPSYIGTLSIALGVGLLTLNWKTAFLLSAILFLYLDNRAEREEKLLTGFPEFSDYKSKTNKYL